MSTILVTGASGGIGTAVCERLAAGGHRLVLCARDHSRLEALRQRLPQDGGAHMVQPCDMASDVSVAAFGAALEAAGTELDGAVLMPPQAHADNNPMPDPDVWRTLFQNSFIGPLETLKMAIARMRPDLTRGHRCKIVIISGISSAQVLGHYATSNVLRTAWLGEAKTLAFALGPKGIHLNTLSLGGTLTPGYSASLAGRAAGAGQSIEERIAAETDNVPLRKYATPAEVAVAVEGLLSPFSDHMTGLNILHDGGFTRAY